MGLIVSRRKNRGQRELRSRQLTTQQRRVVADAVQLWWQRRRDDEDLARGFQNLPRMRELRRGIIAG